MASDRNIIVVDDDEAVRDSLSALLEARDFDVTAYASGQEFLDAFDPVWQGCILLDMKMPGLDGLALHRELVARGARQPVIFITAHGDVSMAVDAMKAGAADFIEKPFDADALVETVTRNVERGLRQFQPAPRPEIAARFASLTPREREVMHLVVSGLPNKVIGFDLEISPRTVELHRARVMRKMGARNLSQLVQMGLELDFASNADAAK